MSQLSSIRLTNVSKVYGAVRALAAVSLEVGGGEVLAVMGPNGAGKSTLLSILALTARPSHGTVELDGTPVKRSDPAVRRRIGLLSHQPLVYPDLSGRENLTLFARLYGVADPGRAVHRVAEQLALSAGLLDRVVRVLSRGQVQRVALARALISEPDLLLLDEPASGLDTAATGRIEAALDAQRERGGAAVVVTHEPELAARVATRAAIFRRGRVVADRAAPRDDDGNGWRELYHGALESSGEGEGR